MNGRVQAYRKDLELRISGLPWHVVWIHGRPLKTNFHKPLCSFQSQSSRSCLSWSYDIILPSLSRYYTVGIRLTEQSGRQRMSDFGWPIYKGFWPSWETRTYPMRPAKGFLYTCSNGSKRINSYRRQRHPYDKEKDTKWWSNRSKDACWRRCTDTDLFGTLQWPGGTVTRIRIKSETQA